MAVPEGRVWTVKGLIEFLGHHDSWLSIDRNTTINSQTANPLEDRLRQIDAHLLSKRGQLHAIEKEVYQLECERLETEASIREGRIKEEMQLVEMLREKGAREERGRLEAQKQLSERKPELERMRLELSEQLRGREEASNAEMNLRHEMGIRQQKVMSDEKRVLQQSEAERKLRQEVADIKRASALDADSISRAQEQNAVLDAQLRKLEGELEEVSAPLPRAELEAVIGAELAQQPNGVVVSSIHPGGPAHQSSVQPGDIIIESHSERVGIQQVLSKEDLKGVIKAHAPGENIGLVIQRRQGSEYKKFILSVAIMSAQPPMPNLPSPPPHPFGL